MVNKRTLKYLLFSILGLILIFAIWYLRNSYEVSEYLEPEIFATHYNGANFVGSQTCLECHVEIYNTHIETAHFNTSFEAAADNMNGSFNEPFNELKLKGVHLKMIQENDNYYQLSKPMFGDRRIKKNKIDIVVGSGVKGQSYLSWQTDKLVQLQASYFKPTDTWVNSPNFPDYSLSRNVDDNCIKCHVTFARNKEDSGFGNTYDRAKMILGIDCERCHGPSEKHVRHHRSNPGKMSPMFVGRYSEYSRQQRLDACAVCHSGLQSQQIKGNPFSFLAGDTLALFSKNYTGRNTNTKLDVHGNQVGLLSESNCFINAQKMDCITCHNPHENQRGNLKSFNLKCMSCHDVDKINGVDKKGTHNTNQDCVSCHMPLIPSKVMTLKLEQSSEEVPVYIRTHLIGIYDKEGDKNP